MLTPPELRLKLYLKILAVFYFVAIIGYLLPGIIDLPDFLKPYTFVNDPAFVNNSVVKIGLFAFLCYIAFADVRKYRAMILIIIFAMILAVIASTTLVLFAKNDYSVGSGMTVTKLLIGSIIFDGAIMVLLIWFFIAADKARYDLKYFSTTEFRTLKALADIVIIGENLQREKLLIKPSEVAYNVDTYMFNFKAESKWITKVVLLGIQFYPMLTFHPPFTYMRKEDRLEFLKKRFYQEVTYRLVPEFWRIFVQAMIRMAKQLCYMGYYNDERTSESIGYVPFSKRNDKDDRIKIFPIEERRTLYVMNEPDINSDKISGDVVIIGSGAAASVLAKGLIEKGRQVLMIERGEHKDRSTFTENEIDMVSQLYADGALQMARDFRFQVFQGSCVGGSTVVNNAVCFDLPMEVLDRWNDTQGLNAGLNKTDIVNSMTKIREMIGVSCVPEMTKKEFLNPGGKLFLAGCEKMKLNEAPNILDSVCANINGCLGCGYCNIGCAYGKKLSMLDTILPETQKEFGRDALQIVAGCEAMEIKSKGSNVTSVICRFKNGREIEVSGKTVIISAGAISSSLLLIKSNVAVKNAGKNLSFNLGSQMTAAFKDVINSYDGLQISHYLRRFPSQGYIIETWFNPPMFQSTAMPGWFDDHYRNMKRYSKMTCGGVLVGTESNAEVRNAGLTGREIDYEPTKTDFEKLLDGIILSGEIFFAAGAESVMPNTFKYYEFTNENELRGLKDLVKDSSELSLGSGHPQGGNVMSSDSGRGVVNPEFKVFGYDNLYVCDASVFPSSIGVNPQMTVMTLADYAVKFIANNK
jgi:choline dehydrogenase-like flavoprotein